ncbi:Putative protease Do-like 14 [Auxenochlorella protothecoides]|uniref:Putative protease Do-like 14 n=1 Tax=Auxenochlorella protothecoides TaxID=3075 RepID=A0A087SFW6_AUXPR|nr:Putative protease Do-like 14 [Auxenochlorella protothecoides]KFM24620.1 Putative protease Do-like 14 [Auxenochlorella protothecoides]
MRHRLSKDVQLLALRSRQLWSGMPSKGGVAPGVPKPEAAPSALGGSGTLPESRLSWADPRRPVSISQGALALILMGGVALGAQHDRLGVAQHGGAASTPSSTPGAASALSHQLAGHLPSFGALSQAAPGPPCLSPHFIADAAAKAAPGVVNIVVVGRGPFPVGSSGSGFLCDPDGTILTNAHDGRVFEGRVVSSDAVSDLAVVRVEAGAPLPCVRLGSASRLRVGEWVVALGSPLHLQNSVTAGIVSCVDRRAAELGLAGARTDYIQTDAAINRGNSGGPLLNLAGEVVGISCMKALAADGVSFAIPVDTAIDVMRQLAAHGRVIRPHVGIKMLELTRHSAARFRERDPGFPDVTAGILVPAVTPGSPADRAGLRQGDLYYIKPPNRQDHLGTTVPQTVLGLVLIPAMQL